jgi:anti-sigma-K factor RskA
VAALETPGHKLVNLEGSNHADLAQFVLLPDGRGYLVKADMPALPTKDTYQLWGIIGGRPISIGIMGQAPGTVTFTIAGSPGPSDLAVTVEPAGGTPAPTTTPVAVGPV